MSLRKSPERTPAFLAACRANAQKSTGPKTQRAKARTRLNGLKHGRYATSFRTKLVPLGDSEALRVYDVILASMIKRVEAGNLRELARAQALARKEWCKWWRTKHGRRGRVKPTVASASTAPGIIKPPFRIAHAQRPDQIVRERSEPGGASSSNLPSLAKPHSSASVEMSTGNGSAWYHF